MRGKRRIRNAVFYPILVFSIFLGGIDASARWVSGESGKSQETGESVEQALDGGYVVAGTSWPYGLAYSGILLIKTERDGTRSWERRLGGGGLNRGHSVCLTADGGYAIAGTKWPLASDYCDVLLVRTDSGGNELWSKTFGGALRDRGYSVAPSGDGGFVILGRTDSFGAGKDDFYLIKADKSGKEVWSKTYGGKRQDWGRAVCLTGDGGYIMVGQTSSFGAGDDDVYLVKTDAMGNEIWSKTFGGKGRDWGQSVESTSDGGYIVAGTSWDIGSKYSDVYLIKTDAEGKEIWSGWYGGSYADHGYSVRQTNDGGYVVAGNTWPRGLTGNSDVYLLKTDPHGREIWTATFGGNGNSYGYAVRQTSEGGYIIAGSTNSFGEGDDDVYLIKTDPAGKAVWSRVFK